MGAEDLIANGKNVVVVEYHINDVFETPYAVARQTYYWVTALPTVYFDGVIENVGGNGSTSIYETYLPLYEERIEIPSDFTIDVQGANSLLTDYVVDVTVERVAPNSSSNLALIFTLTESNIVYAWMGQEMVNYCERFMMPDQNGTSLDFTDSDTQELSFSFSVDPEWELENCELAIWIQDLNTKEVQQAGKRSLSELGGFPARDASAKHVYTPASLCDNVIQPAIEVENLGSVDLESIDVVYRVNNEPEQTFNWSGSIPFAETGVIALPEINIDGMTAASFTAYLVNPNGLSDEFPYNDTLSNGILEAENVSSPVTLVLKLDDYPEQTSWEVYNSEGVVLYSGGNYNDPGAFVTESFDLGSTDCYSFMIYDENGDGLLGAGLYKLMYGSTIFHLGKEFGLEDEVQFGIGLTAVEEKISESITSIYPNPVSGMMFLEVQTAVEMALLGMEGQVLLRQSIPAGTSKIDLSNQVPGVYLLQLTGSLGTEVHKVMVSR